MQTTLGKLIVIDGADGSGKATQAELLVAWLQKEGKTVKYLDFPRYETFFGDVVARFLRGEFGTVEQVSPYLASLAYSLDRKQVADYIRDTLAGGGYVVANRYASSNMAHQGSKFTTPEEKEKFLNWVSELEYTVNGIPKEDVMIYLDVPCRIREKLVEQKGDRAYLQGAAKDIHEADLEHQQKTEDMYQMLTDRFPHWVKIHCCDSDSILSREAIFEKILAALRQKEIV